MSKAIAKKIAAPLSSESLAKVILHGDLKSLTPLEKVSYYNKVCEVIGLNPLTKPFDYIVLNGKEVLYANKGCAEQLRDIKSVSMKILQMQTVNDIYVVTAQAELPNGRTDSGMGAVNIKGLFGEALANAFMKCETKAKRRATLSICGLNMLDEMEVASIPGASSPVMPATPPVAPVILPKEPPAGAPAAPAVTRTTVGREIMAAQKAMNMPDTELAEWAFNKFGKDNLKALSLPEMISFRDEIHEEMKGK